MAATTSGQTSGVFADHLADLDVHLCGDYLHYLQDIVRGAEVEALKLAAHWADLHHPDSEAALTFNRGAEPIMRLGGEGTPDVLRYCVAEFAGLQQQTTSKGQAWIADALDLRHRLPLLWARTLARGADVWKVRRIAVETRHLSTAAAGYVDRRLENIVGLKDWSTVQQTLAAAIITADPELAEQQAKADRSTATARRMREPFGTGMGNLFLRGRIGDILALDGLINRIADCLKSRGDQRLKDERRAAAIPFLANPARALELLASHADDPDPGPATLFDDWPVHDHHDGTGIGWGQERSPFDKLRERSAAPRQPNPPKPERSPFDDLWDLIGAPPDEEPPPRWLSPSKPTDPPSDPFADKESPPRWLTDPFDKFRERGGTLTERGETLRDRDGAPPEDQQGKHELIMKPPTIDPKRLQPVVNLYIHLAAESLQPARNGADIGVARFEGVGPVTINTIREFLGQTPCTIKVQPVIDLNDEPAPVDAYEIPHRIREHVTLTIPTSMFPYSNKESRTAQLDHADPYQPGKTKQTAVANLQPLGQFEHLVKTHGRWSVSRPSKNTAVWRSPTGHHFLVTNAGTISLGRTDFAQNVWRASRPTQRTQGG